MTVLYDNRDIYKEILLDLPFREGIGTLITQDVAKPHHPVALVNTPTWTALDTGLMTLNLNGADEYLQCNGANCTDLDFTSEDYSIGGWINWTIDEYSQIVIARYEVSISGWEVYLTNAAGLNYLSLRHHHAAGATTRTGAFSVGWTPGTPFFFGISRSGVSASMTRNGVAVTTVSDVLIDPETCAEDLNIGVRYTKNANFYKGMKWRPRIWPKYLTDEEWRIIYELEKGWFPS